MLPIKWGVRHHCRWLVVQNDKQGSGAIEHGLYLQACKTGFCQTRAHISFAMNLKSMKKSVSSVSERSGTTPQTQHASLFEGLLPDVVHVCSTGFTWLDRHCSSHLPGSRTEACMCAEDTLFGLDRDIGWAPFVSHTDLTGPDSPFLDGTGRGCIKLRFTTPRQAGHARKAADAYLLS